MASNEDTRLQRLQQFLADRFPDQLDSLRLRPIPGGRSNPTYRLESGAARMVLRSKPSGSLQPSAHAIDREYRVLSALAGGPVPVPRPVIYCADTAVWGVEFYLMEHVPGHTHRDPALPGLAPAVRALIYDEIARVLAALHEVDVAGAGLQDFGRPDGYIGRQIRRWTHQYRAVCTEHRPDVERLIEWLPANIPPDDGQASLLHGDFRIDNLLFHDDGRLAGVLDWELSTLGHPACDLAYYCAQLRLPAGELCGLGGVDRSALGIPTEGEFISAYLAHRRTVSRLRGWDFFLVLGLFRLAAICQGVYARGLSGNAKGDDTLACGPRVDVIAGAGVRILDQLDR